MNMDHIESLNLSIEAADSKEINIDNLEFYWYGPWNNILNHWFRDYLTINPQYDIPYQLMSRDDEILDRNKMPDFVAIRYCYKDNGCVGESVKLIVENKRSSNNMEKGFKTNIKQLEDQISALFSHGEHEHLYGIIAIGRYWKWYRYIF